MEHREDKNHRETNYDNLITMVTAIISDYRTRDLTQSVNSLLKDADLLKELAIKLRRQSSEIAQGHLFEQLHVVKFNLDAISKNRPDLKAYTTASVGDPHNISDIIVKKGTGKILYQAKSCKTASKTLFEISKPKYDGQGRIVPSDQIEKVKSLAVQRINKKTIKASDYIKAYEKITDRIKVGKVSSKGVTRDEAIKHTDPEVADLTSNVIKTEGILTEMHTAGMEAAKLGGLLTLGFSAITHTLKAIRGDITPDKAVTYVLADTVTNAASCYAVSALTKGIPHALRSLGVCEAGIKTISKCNAPVAVACSIVECSKLLIRYIKGELNNKQLVEEIGSSILKTGSAFYYGLLGSVIIPIPVVGTIVGAMFGHYMTTVFIKSGLLSLGEAPVVKEARERRNQIESMCNEMILLMRLYRQVLEEAQEQHFEQRNLNLLQIANILEEGIIFWDSNRFIKGMEKLNNMFNLSLPFKSQEEFDKLLEDPQDPIVF